MSEPPALQITLNPNGVAAPAQRTVIIATQVVATALRALANDDLSPPEMQGGPLGYQFTGLEMSDEERRVTFQNWILGKGFQDLARGIRETLEEAVFYLAMIKREPNLTMLAEIEAEIAAIRATAAKLVFPKLLEDVNAGLTAPMVFDAEFLSLQKARNCLEHRGGRVGARDVDDTGTMTLSFPRLRMFYRRGDAEIELLPGEVIDTRESDTPFGKGEDVPIYIHRVTRSRTYALDEPVVILASDFFEIAMACHLFASDVAAKLPILPAAQPLLEDDDTTGGSVTVG
ncbi:hypothetical protein [Pleomorphomonas koreensis]|uniref:hypothetical protein n=1 Tax=Pleomorphomonas koreensis TaxID=257440 RepID=UPI00069E024D|nr:hypothetical protein [Pleomorphomonas koreensis]